jgi:hypothetical protein
LRICIATFIVDMEIDVSRSWQTLDLAYAIIDYRLEYVNNAQNMEMVEVRHTPTSHSPALKVIRCVMGILDQVKQGVGKEEDLNVCCA